MVAAHVMWAGHVCWKQVVLLTYLDKCNIVHHFIELLIIWVFFQIGDPKLFCETCLHRKYWMELREMTSYGRVT